MPAPTSYLTNAGKALLGTGFSWLTDPIKLGLLDAGLGWTPTPDVQFVTELAAYELDTDNYARLELEDRTIDTDDGDNVARWKASGLVFPDLGPGVGGPVVGGGILILDTGDDATSTVIGYLASIVGSTNGTAFTVAFPAGGLIVLRTPASA